MKGRGVVGLLSASAMLITGFVAAAPSAAAAAATAPTTVATTATTLTAKAASPAESTPSALAARDAGDSKGTVVSRGGRGSAVAPGSGAASRGGGGSLASGSDASCPAATPGSASGAVGAPTLVRAIGGSQSATVLWCPPAGGAGSVVAYKVTSSGGQQVTSRVPNDWAIVDGLTDGTAYTFTVTAIAKGGASGPAATSSSVTPAPIAPPQHVLTGPPEQVGYDGHSMIIGGQRVFITAGEFDPFRTPSPSLWLDDLQKIDRKSVV